MQSYDWLRMEYTNTFFSFEIRSMRSQQQNTALRNETLTVMNIVLMEIKKHSRFLATRKPLQNQRQCVNSFTLWSSRLKLNLHVATLVIILCETNQWIRIEPALHTQVSMILKHF